MKLLVTRCAACPFFEDSPLKNGLLGLIGNVLLADTQYGICTILPSGEHLPTTDIQIGLPPGPEREAEEPRYAKARSRRFIENKQTIPDDCPLRLAEVTVTIAGGD